MKLFPPRPFLAPLLFGILFDFPSTMVVAAATSDTTAFDALNMTTVIDSSSTPMIRGGGTIRAIKYDEGKSDITNSETHDVNSDASSSSLWSWSPSTSFFGKLVQRSLQQFDFPSIGALTDPPAPTDPPTLPPRPDGFLDALYQLVPPTPTPTAKPTTAKPTPAPTLPLAPTPPVREQRVDRNGMACGMATRGTLLLHGGIFNYSTPRNDALGQAIIETMETWSDGRIGEPLVFIPGARRTVTDEDESTFEDQWRDIMAEGVPFSVLHADNEGPQFTNVADAAQANTDAFVEPLRSAMGVFIPGGRQWRFLDAYKYTKTEEELWNVLDRGGVIAGTSAGAAIMGSYMPRGDPDGSTIMVADREWYRHGFGFVSNVAVDNHVGRRGREMEMYEVMNNENVENRYLLGIGLNENTFVVVKGRYFEVRGDRGEDSIVRVYDCSSVSTDVVCDFTNAPYVELTPGNWYDLCERRQVPGPDFDEDTDSGFSPVGSYGLPYEFKQDYRLGGPGAFLCSGRPCLWKSSPIAINSNRDFITSIAGGPRRIRISGTVYMEDNDGFAGSFRPSDRLAIRYSFNDAANVWTSIFDTSFEQTGILGLLNEQSVFATISVPSRATSIKIEIEAETETEGNAEFQVSDIVIEAN